MSRSSIFAGLVLVLGAFAAPLHAQVSVTTLGVPYTQSFDTLPASGSATWTNNSTIPGWFHARTGTGTTLVANDGSSNAGNLYSYGTGTATDRALGSVGSGNAAVGNLFWGLRLQNNSGATITQLDVSYTGEQWRNSAAAAQTIAFSYLIGSPTVTGSLAEFQSAGVAVPQLDFTSPITGGTAGALNGNLAANQVTRTFSISGLSIPNGTEVMLRWADPDHTGADHGLSIDSLSVTPIGGLPPQPNLTIDDVSLTEGNAGTTTFTFTVSLSAPAGPGGVTFDIATADGTAQDDNPATEDNDYVAQSLTGQTIPAGNSTYAFNVSVNGDTTVEPNETFFVNVTNVTGATVADGQGQGTLVNDDLAASADLVVTKADTPDPVSAGELLTYTLTLANNGPDAAASVTLDDPLPVGTVFESLSQPGGFTCTTPAVGANGTVSCSIASLPVGTSVFSLVTRVDTGVAAGTVLSNTATAASPTGDPTPLNRSDTETTTVLSEAGLAVALSETPDPVVAGNTLVYTVLAQNTGPTTAFNAVLTDVLPAQTRFTSLAVPAGWTCTTPAVGANGTVSCTHPAFALGNATFTLTVSTDPALAPGSTISNTVQLAADNESTPASDTETTGVLNQVNLSLTKSDAPDPVAVGGVLTWTITANNAGPSAAVNAALTDTIPAGVNFTSLTQPAGWSCMTPAVGTNGTVSCSNPAFGSGAAVFTLVGTLGPGVTAGATLSNTATITSGSTETAPGDESATATTTVVAAPAPLLRATKSVAPGPRTPGAPVTYTIVIRNDGNAAQADNAGNEFTDVLPAGLTLVSASATSGTAVATVATNTVTWNGTVPAAGTVTITINATIAGIPGSTVSNQGTVSYDADLNGSNESTAVTDDPATQGAGDPTTFGIAGSALAIPAGSPWSLALLLALVALGGLVALRVRSG